MKYTDCEFKWTKYFYDKIYAIASFVNLFILHESVYFAINRLNVNSYPYELHVLYFEQKRNSELTDGCRVSKVGGILRVSRETCGDCCLSRYLHERRVRSRSTYVHHVAAHVDYRWQLIVAPYCEQYDLQTRAEPENSRSVRWRPSCIIALPLPDFALCSWLKPPKLPTMHFTPRNVSVSEHLRLICLCC